MSGKACCIKPFPPQRLQTSHFSHALQTAHSAIQRYGHFLNTLPSFQLVVPALTWLETAASLESQQIYISITQLLYALSKKSFAENPTLAQLVHYHTALLHSSTHSHPVLFSKHSLLKLHQLVKAHSLPAQDIGCYRTQQNWVGPLHCKMEDAYFYPPCACDVPGLMKTLITYGNTADKDPLVQLALLFAQLLIIHPFMDGNGRIARLLVPAFLHHYKLLPAPSLFISNYLKIHRLRYFQSLFNITEKNAWEEWVLFFLQAITTSTRQHHATARKILTLSIQCPAPTFLFQYPVFSTSLFKKCGGDQTLLQQLCRAHWVKEEENHLYLFHPLIDLLDQKKKRLRKADDFSKPRT